MNDSDIEITDEMLFAGIAAMPYLGDDDLPGDLTTGGIVVAVYRAMRALEGK
jgi:hypothetical protein